jgi:hypothetical protein
MVALPPVARRTFNGGHGATVMVAPDTPPDVFALAVPCPSNDCENGLLWDDMTFACPTCSGTEWVHHGDYRVLEVLPISQRARGDCPPNGHVVVTNVSVYLCDGHGVVTDIGPLPSAVPGGVALIVERVEP